MKALRGSPADNRVGVVGRNDQGTKGQRPAGRATGHNDEPRAALEALNDYENEKSVFN
jgi:hypothetical protein